jgi:hypothetical protein
MNFRHTAALATVIVAALTSLAAAAGQSDELRIAKGWARATPGGAKVGAAYIEIIAGSSADKLIGVSTPVAARAEIHTHTEVDGVMKMRRLDAIEIPANMAHVLAPGGDHIMLFDLKAPLKQGTSLPLTLTFEKAGEKSIEAKVIWIGANGFDAPGPKAKPSDEPGSDSGSDSGSQSDSHSGSHD